MAGFRLHVGETRAGRRVGNADKMLAGRALNLPAGELGFAKETLAGPAGQDQATKTAPVMAL